MDGKAASALGGQEQLRHAGRMLVLLHAFLRNRYDNDVLGTFIDPFFSTKQMQYWDNWCSKVRLVGGTIAYISLAICMPFVYANFLMPYPCQTKEMLVWRPSSQDAAQKMEVEEDGCRAEDWLRSWRSFLLVPVAMLTFMLWNLVLRVIIRWRVGEILVGIVKQVGYSAAYTTHEHAKYSDPFVFNLVISLYGTLVGVMSVLSVWMLSPVGALAAYAMGHILLGASEILLAPEGSFVAMCKQKLHLWPCGKDACPGLLVRLKQQSAQSIIFVTLADLQAVLALDELNHFVNLINADTPERLHERVAVPCSLWYRSVLQRPICGCMAGWEWRSIRLDRNWVSYVAQEVFVLDTNEQFKVAKETNEETGYQAPLLSE